MKTHAIVLLLICCCSVSTAQTFKHFSTRLVLGTKLHTDNYEGPNIDEAWQLKSSPLIGFDITYQKWPRLSFTYLHDFTFFLVNQKRTYPLAPEVTNLFSSSRGNFLGFYYTKNHCKYGLGHYNSLQEDVVNHLFIFEPFLKKHIAASFSFVSGKAEFEFVKLVQYKRLVSIFAIDNQYFTIKYKLFGKKEGFLQPKSKEKTRTALVFKAGMRGFVVRNAHLPGEKVDKAGVSFLAGLELRFKKINIALFAERDWWLRLNGGSPYRDVKGYVVNSVFGIKHSIPALKYAFVSIGYDWTTDFNTIYDTWNKIAAGEEKVDLFYYNVKGIAIGLGYPISNKFDVDLRGIFPLRGEKGINPMRYSLGLTYKIKT